MSTHIGAPIQSIRRTTSKLDVWSREALLFVGITAVYFSAAKLGLAFAYLHTNVSPVWPPTGVALAAVLLFGKRVAPAIFVGAFLANANSPVPVPAALGIALGNTLEALAGGWLLRLARFHISFDRARDVFKFVAVALMCTMVSATIGVVSLCLSHAASWSEFDSLWVTWWLGDVGGAVTFAPLFIAWAKRLGVPLVGWRFIEIILLLLLISLSALATYGDPAPAAPRYYPLTRLLIPVLLWAAFRLGYRGLTLASVLVTMFAAWGTVGGTGPIVSFWAGESPLVLQLYISSNAVTFLFLASVLEERRHAENSRRLDQQRLSTNLAISRILAEAPPLDVAINRILASIGETLGWKIGAMWTLGHEKNRLRCLTVWRRSRATESKFEIDSLKESLKSALVFPAAFGRPELLHGSKMFQGKKISRGRQSLSKKDYAPPSPFRC